MKSRLFASLALALLMTSALVAIVALGVRLALWLVVMDLLPPPPLWLVVVGPTLPIFALILGYARRRRLVTRRS
jgi:hypothetical protein